MKEIIFLIVFLAIFLIIFCLFIENGYKIKKVYNKLMERGELLSIEYINTVQYKGKNVRIYKIVYNSIDSRSEVITPNSGTLYIPQKIKNKHLVSYKRGTISEIGDNSLGYIRYKPGFDIDILEDYHNLELEMSCLGNIVCSADGIGYGKSKGRPHYTDPRSEVYTYVDIVVATKNLMDKHSNLFGFKVKELDVIQIGYSLGSLHSMSVAEELSFVNNIKIKRVLCGAPISFNEIVDYICDNETDSISFSILFFTILCMINNRHEALVGLKKHIYNNILPLFDDINSYYDENFRQTLVTRYIISATMNNPDEHDVIINGVETDPRLVFNLEFLKDYNNFHEHVDFNNRFKTFKHLENVPIIAIYSESDELAVYKGNDYVSNFRSRIPNLTGKIEDKCFNYNAEDYNDAKEKLQEINNDEFYAIKVTSEEGHLEFSKKFIEIVQELL